MTPDTVAEEPTPEAMGPVELPLYMRHLNNELNDAMLAAEELRKLIAGVVACWHHGQWTPTKMEELWKVLPGPPRLFPYDTVPTRREFRDGCTAYLEECDHQRSPLSPIPVPPVRPVHTGIPHSPEDKRAREAISTEYYRQVHAYYLAAIEESSKPRGQDLCWEDIDRLERVLMCAAGHQPESVRRGYEDCAQKCELYRRSLCRAMAQRNTVAGLSVGMSEPPSEGTSASPAGAE